MSSATRNSVRKRKNRNNSHDENTLAISKTHWRDSIISPDLLVLGLGISQVTVCGNCATYTRSSQTSYYPSKLDVRSREQSDTANLAIGFEYKHFSVVCHEWYQALRLILFSHNNITIQRSTMQKTSLPVWLQMPCRWSLQLYIERRIMFLFRLPRLPVTDFMPRRSLTKHPVQQSS